MAYLLILLAHVIGDFTLQFNELAKAKDKNIKYLLLHLIIYMLPITLVLVMYGNIIKVIILFMTIMLSHFIVDYLKSKLSKKYYNPFAHNLFFILDQAIHIVILLILTYWVFKGNVVYNWFINKSLLSNIVNKEYFISIILVTLICLSPTSIFIKHTLVYIDYETNKNKKAKLERLLSNTHEVDEINQIKREINELDYQIVNWNNTDNSNRIGSIIGKLERMVILILTILNLYASVGLVFTAKSLARFKQLEDKDFAEKYLVGTLSSFLITLILVYFTSFFK